MQHRCRYESVYILDDPILDIGWIQYSYSIITIINRKCLIISLIKNIENILFYTHNKEMNKSKMNKISRSIETILGVNY